VSKQNYPKMLFKRDGDKVLERIVATEQAHEGAKAYGWITADELDGPKAVDTDGDGVSDVEEAAAATYVHQHYPKMLFTATGDQRVVHDAVEQARAAAAGWLTADELDARPSDAPETEPTVADEPTAEKRTPPKPQAAKKDKPKTAPKGKAAKAEAPEDDAPVEPVDRTDADETTAPATEPTVADE
jgi:hypothetical protein